MAPLQMFVACLSARAREERNFGLTAISCKDNSCSLASKGRLGCPRCLSLYVSVVFFLLISWFCVRIVCVCVCVSNASELSWLSKVVCLRKLHLGLVWELSFLLTLIRVNFAKQAGRKSLALLFV